MEFLKIFLGGTGGAAMVTGLYGLLQWRLNRQAQREDRAAGQLGDEQARQDRELRELNRKLDVLFLADRTLLYDRMKYLAKSYIERGYVTVEELEDLNRMHEVYHDPDKLNGNGFLKDLMKTVNTTLEIRAN